MAFSLDLKRVVRGRRVILENVQFSIPTGTMTALIGRNGCGKSTVVSCIGGFLPYDGEITVDGLSCGKLSPAERAARIAVMLQQLRAPHITVRTLLSYGRTPYLSLTDSLSPKDWEQIDFALAEAELTDLAERYLDTLSGGELRRAYLGMALAQNTSFLVLDECTANMDMDHEMRFLQTILSLRERGKSVLAVMHNLEHALFADRIVLLDGGTRVFAGTPTEFLAGGWSERIFHAAPVTTPEGYTFFRAISPAGIYAMRERT